MLHLLYIWKYADFQVSIIFSMNRCHFWSWGNYYGLHYGWRRNLFTSIFYWPSLPLLTYIDTSDMTTLSWTTFPRIGALQPYEHQFTVFLVSMAIAENSGNKMSTHLEFISSNSDVALSFLILWKTYQEPWPLFWLPIPCSL